MSDKACREGSTRRSSSRKLLAESALPAEYLEALEQKRKQLDESIHKYIAAKEREYKQYEKDLRQKHKIVQGQEEQNHSRNGKRRTSSETTQDDAIFDLQLASAAQQRLASSSADQRVNEPEVEARPADHRGVIAGLSDGRTGVEREKDFIGLFTPPFLPALSSKDVPSLERTTSAPAELLSPPTNVDGGVEMARAHSDSAVQAKAKRPSQLALQHRTSSSGSSADGRLASAMKSATQKSKRKRVSLAVGDSIVAPSDSVPLTLSNNNNTPSHSRIRSDRAGSPEQLAPTQMNHKSSIAESLARAEHHALFTVMNSESEPTIPHKLSSPPLRSPRTSPSVSAVGPNIDADGDLFDLEEDSALPEALLTSDDLDDEEESDDEIAGRVELEETPEDLSPSSRYDPEAGTVDEPANGGDSAVPHLAFGPGSAAASQQPTQPGFRKPSVVHDPVFAGQNYAAAEKNAVENDVYGSSFTRLGSKSSFTTGSVGESYMEQHNRMRSERKELQVKS